MSVRYIVQKITLPSKQALVPHPLWPGDIVFKILDKDTGNLSFGCYTKYETAKEYCEKKNLIL